MNIKRLVIVSLFFIGCNPLSQKAVDKESIQKQNIYPKIENFVLTRTKEGKLMWKIVADKSEMDRTNNYATVVDGKINFYNKEDFVSTAKFVKAVINLKTNDIDFKGENIINTIENEKIITYDMKYNSSENKVFSEKEIFIYRNNNTIKGIGFETSDGFKNIKIKKNVIIPG